MALWTKVDNDAGKPKYLSDDLRNDQSVSDKDATLGVDVAEATTAANIAKGIKTPGWTKYRTYTDNHGNTRNKAEVLVAFGGDFASGDNDSLPPLPVITIDTQPASTTVTDGVDATFTVSATAVGTTVLSYQWEVSVDTGATWTEVLDATTDTLTVASLDPEYVTDNQFRVIVSGTNGAVDVTSDAATLTITV